jgi:pyruvate dehydrogenase E1 component alpha subunit
LQSGARIEGGRLPKQAVKKEVDEAVEKAKQGSIPPPEMLWQNIYAAPLGAKLRGLDSQTKIQL